MKISETAPAVEVTSEQCLEKVKIRGYALSLAMGLSDRRELPIAKLCI